MRSTTIFPLWKVEKDEEQEVNLRYIRKQVTDPGLESMSVSHRLDIVIKIFHHFYRTIFLNIDCLLLIAAAQTSKPGSNIAELYQTCKQE